MRQIPQLLLLLFVCHTSAFAAALRFPEYAQHLPFDIGNAQVENYQAFLWRNNGELVVARDVHLGRRSDNYQHYYFASRELQWYWASRTLLTAVHFGDNLAKFEYLSVDEKKANYWVSYHKQPFFSLPKAIITVNHQGIAADSRDVLEAPLCAYVVNNYLVTGVILPSSKDKALCSGLILAGEDNQTLSATLSTYANNYNIDRRLIGRVEYVLMPIVWAPVFHQTCHGTLDWKPYLDSWNYDSGRQIRPQQRSGYSVAYCQVLSYDPNTGKHFWEVGIEKQWIPEQDPGEVVHQWAVETACLIPAEDHWRFAPYQAQSDHENPMKINRVRVSTQEGWVQYSDLMDPVIAGCEYAHSTVLPSYFCRFYQGSNYYYGVTQSGGSTCFALSQPGIQRVNILQKAVKKDINFEVFLNASYRTLNDEL